MKAELDKIKEFSLSMREEDCVRMFGESVGHHLWSKYTSFNNDFMRWYCYLDKDNSYIVAKEVERNWSKICIQKMLDEYEKEHGQKPLYAECYTVWNDEPDEMHSNIIKLNSEIDEATDDMIFFNVSDASGLIDLTLDDNGEDFKVVLDSIQFSNEI